MLYSTNVMFCLGVLFAFVCLFVVWVLFVYFSLNDDLAYNPEMFSYRHAQ